jgi:hypothetical protein
MHATPKEYARACVRARTHAPFALLPLRTVCKWAFARLRSFIQSFHCLVIKHACARAGAYVFTDPSRKPGLTGLERELSLAIASFNTLDNPSNKPVRILCLCVSCASDFYSTSLALFHRAKLLRVKAQDSIWYFVRIHVFAARACESPLHLCKRANVTAHMPPHAALSFHMITPPPPPPPPCSIPIRTAVGRDALAGAARRGNAGIMKAEAPLTASTSIDLRSICRTKNDNQNRAVREA